MDKQIPRLDVTQFGRIYWIALAYATGTAIFCNWPGVSLHGSRLFFVLFLIGVFGGSASLRELSTATATDNRNATVGSGLALLLTLGTLVATLLCYVATL